MAARRKDVESVFLEQPCIFAILLRSSLSAVLNVVMAMELISVFYKWRGSQWIRRETSFVSE